MVGEESPCLQPCPSVILERSLSFWSEAIGARTSLPAPPLRALSRRPATPRLVPPAHPNVMLRMMGHLPFIVILSVAARRSRRIQSLFYYYFPTDIAPCRMALGDRNF